ncbi:MAG: hypothetical protein HY926_07275 [Elusimicrobia bacterium]|nr:hypothetical protein [Elusimicrobiota bacterium]
MIPRAKEPFRFCSRLSLTVLTGIKAEGLAELLAHLRTVPEPVIYHHTHRFLQQHQHLVPEPPNDFAYWVTNMLGDEELGERLAAIDTVRFDSLDGLRQAIIATVEDRAGAAARGRVVPPGKEFHFMSAIRFSLLTSYQAEDLPGFAQCLQKVSISSLYLHVFEARLRPPLGVNDFSHWFKNQLGDEALAAKVANLDPYTQTLEGLRRRILGIIAARLQEAPYAEA